MANANYIYNVEYALETVKTKDIGDSNKKWLNDINKAIDQGLKLTHDEKFKKYSSQNITCIKMKTTYPGTLIGTGNSHSAGAKGEMELGFTFDYVTGVPYLPGSSLKGILRNAFRCECENYIKEQIRKDIDIEKLKDAIFGGGVSSDISKQARFLDSYVVERTGSWDNGTYMGQDSITPHGNSKLSEPNPITMIRINPEVVFEIRFVPADTELLGSDEQKKLFTDILLDFGIGAKTNVGYGALEKVAQTDDTVIMATVCGYNKKNTSAKLRREDGQIASLHFKDVPGAKYGEIDKVLPVNTKVRIRYIKTDEKGYDQWKLIRIIG